MACDSQKEACRYDLHVLKLDLSSECAFDADEAGAVKVDYVSEAYEVSKLNFSLLLVLGEVPKEMTRLHGVTVSHERSNPD